MSTTIEKVKRLGQSNVNLLFAVEAYALKHGYSKNEAKAIAVGAVERRRRAGYRDFAMKIYAIQRHRAKVGTRTAATFKQHTKGRVATSPVDLRLIRNDSGLGSMGFCCACDESTDRYC